MIKKDGTLDKDLVKKEKADLKFKSLAIDKIFTDAEKNMSEFLDIADSLNTFQEKEIQQIKDVIKLIKRYHISQLAGVNTAVMELRQLSKMISKREKKK